MKQPRILLAALALNAAGSITAQCTVAWQDGERSPGPAPGIYGTAVHATAWWDPDGAGPAGPLLVIGGNFELPSVGTSNLATWDPVDRRWGAFPAHPNGQVNAIAVLSNGDLQVTIRYLSTE